MRKIKIRHLVEKRQKGHSLFYWQPTMALRSAGFLTRRLAERTNILADAIVEAEKLNAEVDAWRAGTVPSVIEAGTVPWLIRKYQADPWYKQRAAKTQRGYDQCLSRLEAWSKRAGHPQLATITRDGVVALFNAIDGKAPFMARAVVRMARRLFNYGVVIKAMTDNPASKLGIKGMQAREAFWTDDQADTMLAACRAAGRESLALAFLLAVNLGQREGDVLALSWTAYNGTSIKLRQGKTGSMVNIPVMPDLKAALDAAIRQSPIIVISETTCRPYKEDNFTHVFAEIRDAAGIEGVKFMDLRRTAVVRLALAGCTVPEIAAITGHSIDRTAKILETYLPRTTQVAQAAIAKLAEYRK